MNFTIDSVNDTNRVGNNLFHSFKEFSIPTGGSATFNNSTNVVNIINRVTGGNISNIDGLIKAQGNANLFLINPSGIVFGENARLDIGGSFIGSTAESIKFADGEFSAIDTATEPLLSINVPLGLQMGSNSAAIEVQGTLYNLTSNSSDLFNLLTVISDNGLRVKAGNTLTLLGSEIYLNGGVVTADSGRIELAAVNSGLVNINPNFQGWSLSYEGLENFGDINFSDRAFAGASNTGSTSIVLQGRNIDVSDGSSIFMLSHGNTARGEIKITATNSIEILDGGAIISSNSGIGEGGDLNIDAKSISIIGFDVNTFRPSILSASTLGIGDAGALNINTESLIIQDGGTVDSSTLASGKAGSITINATDFIEVSGTVPANGNPSSIISSANLIDESFQQIFGLPSIPSGNSGNVTINTPDLKVTDGAEVTVKNDGTGMGGILEINANSILLDSEGKITASTQSVGGGDIDLQVEDTLILRNRSTISAESFGTGNGGNLNINSSVIAGLENSDIVANARLGNGGNIEITTNALFGLQFRDELTTESDINASSQFGFNGTVEINGSAIDLTTSLAKLPSDVIDSNQKIVSGCSVNQESSFTIVGKGGLYPNPVNVLLEVNVWQDLRDLSTVNSKKKKIIPVNNNSPKATVEATGWIIDKEGNIEFVVGNHHVKKQDNWRKISNCKGKVVN